MKCLKILVGATLMMSAAVASATDFTNTYVINLIPGAEILTGDYGSSFAGVNMKNKTFSDTFNFTLPASTNVDSGLQSVSTTIKKITTAGINFSLFDLYKGSTLLLAGNVGSFGTQSLANLSFEGPLTAGLYSLKVEGIFSGTSGGSYSGNLNVSPVPEPASWGMMAIGLAGVGFMAARRKSAS